MDKNDLMEIERRKYIVEAYAGEQDWAMQNDPSETLDRLARYILNGNWSSAQILVDESIEAAADAHVEIMDDLCRFDDADIIADLKAAATDMRDLADAIRSVK